MSGKSIRLVIVEDQQLLAHTLATCVRKQTDFRLAGCAQDGEAGWELCLREKPDLALVDIELPKMDGLELGRRLVHHDPSLRVVAMSGMTDPHTIWRVRESGVHGYIEKAQSLRLLLKALRTVAAGETYFSPAFEQVREQWLGQPEAFYKILSDREQDVLRRVVTGWNDARIGGQLGISVATVEVHRKHIRQKLGLHNDRELLAYAREWGLDKALRP